ncbi:MAG TPA: DNA-3-methyladenine glycosylase [Acidimicrobiia bacterium]|jgi:DNA-3-methyladenine glycosylase|nr:DNA-3-methyladenine glycosylase [Acidimicrobiia bacterium]
MAATTILEDILTGPPEEAAPLLLGMHLVSRVGGVEVRLRLTEVEAYKGSDDPASHAYRGETARNGSMFRKPGTLYVYRSYGIHNCANTSAGPEGVGWGILMRGGEVVEGESVATRRRGRATDLANGPGKLCQALGITIEHNGGDLLDTSSVVHFEMGEPPEKVMATPRIGISRAQDRPWRFVAVTQLSA